MDKKAPDASASFGTILSDLLDSTQLFVRKEIELHKAEAMAKVQELAAEKGRGIALLAGGGIFALLGLAFLGLTLFLGLQQWFSPWLAALIVTLLYFLVAGILAFVGKSILTPAEESEALDEPSTYHTERQGA